MKTSRTTFPLSEKDREAIKTIREYYGVHPDADALRIALHELERLIKGATPTQAPMILISLRLIKIKGTRPSSP